jgi:hypothetical protein
MSQSHKYAIPAVIADADWSRFLADLWRMPLRLEPHATGTGVDVIAGQVGFQLLRPLPETWGMGRTTAPDGIERWAYFLAPVDDRSPLCDALCALSYRIPGVVLASDSGPGFLDRAFDRYSALLQPAETPTPPVIDEARFDEICGGLLAVLGYKEFALP